MNLYAIATYSEPKADRTKYKIAVDLSVASDENRAIEQVQQLYKELYPDWLLLSTEIMQVPIESGMLPQIADNMRWINFRQAAEE